MMVQLSVSVRSHRVGLLALFATPVIGAESGKAQLASRGRAPAVERMRLVSDDVAPPPDAGGQGSETARQRTALRFLREQTALRVDPGPDIPQT
jgi:hypothetical protein